MLAAEHEQCVSAQCKDAFGSGADRNRAILFFFYRLAGHWNKYSSDMRNKELL
jgi:hypothetical protein